MVERLVREGGAGIGLADVQVMLATATADAFAATCTPYYADVLRLARHLCRRDDRAADLAQETFVQALAHWHQFTPDTNARAWLLCIARNTFINQYRRRQRERRAATYHPESIAQRTHSHPTPVDADAALIREALAIAMAGLGEHYRAVIERADLRDMRYAAIAAELDIPVGTVMSRLSRARGAVRAQLAALV